MQDYTEDNRRAQVFHSHPITVKGISPARNSPTSTIRVSQRNKISLAFHVLSHAPHTKEKKSDPAHSTPARAISRSWLNKDSSNWGANRDGKHLLLALGPCWPRGFCLWSAALATTFLQELRWNSLSNTHTRRGVGESAHTHTHTPWKKCKCKHTNKLAGLRAYMHQSRLKLHIFSKLKDNSKKNTLKSLVTLVQSFCVEKNKNLPVYFLSPASKNMTYPHFQQEQAKHLTQQWARRHLWTASPAVVFPPPVTGRWFTRPARLHLGTVCTGAYSLPAQTEEGGKKNPPPSMLHRDLQMQLIK